MKFKTNIKCGGCIATVTPILDEVVGKGKWKVDLADPNRILIAEIGDANLLRAELKKVGYMAEPFQ